MQKIQQNYDQTFIWLFTTSILLVVLIWVGGLTRLTGSGLSITEWEVFSGILPPLTNQKWIEYFELYKKIPEYQKINFGMSIDEFKVIFWWEYIHRILARILVLTFCIPLLYFFLKKKIQRNKSIFLFFVLSLFLTQGFMGWYMVKSGLVSETDVSHLRLAAHLSLAIIIYGMIFWALLNNQKLNFKIKLNKSTILMIIMTLLIFLQIIWGAFTSGLNAGLLYQTWPLMNEKFIADDIILTKILTTSVLNNPSYVQLTHRFLAYLIIFYCVVIYFVHFKKSNLKLPFKYIFLALVLQVILGILTLISGLNIYLASFHQMGSILLISSAIYGLFYVNHNQNLIDSSVYKQ